jgi:hypothetical protein
MGGTVGGTLGVWVAAAGAVSVGAGASVGTVVVVGVGVRGATVTVALGEGVGSVTVSQPTSDTRSAAVRMPSLFASDALHGLPSNSAATSAATSVVRLSAPSQSASPEATGSGHAGEGTQRW